MPITDQNSEYFYQGQCAELYVSSLFYFAGYEAQKVSPDTGIDLVITNIARHRFKSEPHKTAYVQVKSALVDMMGTSFNMQRDELDFLSDSDDRYCVFVMFNDLELVADHDEFNIYADQIDRLIDMELINYENQLIEIEGRQRRAKGLLSFHDISRYKATVFWLNAKQIAQSRVDGLWKEKNNGWKLTVTLQNGIIFLDDTPISAALSEVRYIMRDARSADHFKNGKFSIHHL